MEPFDQDELSEAELDRMLASWNAPLAPARLRSALLRESHAPWWRRLWTFSVPLPVACCLALVIAATVWWWPRTSPPVAPQVLVKTERVEVPVIRERVITKYVYRNEPAARVVVSGFDINGLRPVAELRPRIIRSGDAKN